MTKTQIKFVQKHLNDDGYNVGPVDGICGRKTLTAVDKAVDARPNTPSGWRRWSTKRKLVAYIQLLAQENTIEVGAIDGYWGQLTDHAYETLMYIDEHGEPAPPWRDIEPNPANPNRWPGQNQAELERFYGQVGENQTRIELPYAHKLAWNKARKIRSFQCHEKVHESMKRVLERTLEHYGLKRIQELRLDLWGGCLNVRKKRGGSTWSMHSWGIACDYDPERNRLKWGRDRAAFARPEYGMWWRFWEEEGWVSLGRSNNFDWMHIQAAKL